MHESDSASYLQAPFWAVFGEKRLVGVVDAGTKETNDVVVLQVFHLHTVSIL